MSKAASVGIEAERVSRLNCVGCQKTLDVGHLPSFSEIKCPECNARQIIPAKFGGFLLISKLGAGGMGVIYHAMDKELGRQVALKVMKKSLGDNAEFVQSFRHEARAAAALNHRNVVQIYSFGQVKGQPYIVMELVAGGRLEDMIGEGKTLHEARALAIHLEVTEGLDAASDVGLIHSDIKPANILFGQSGEAKVVDFGLASYVGQQQQGGQIWGTPYYIAPEKARGKKVDFRSDIYSLGATLFHVLAGQPPFDGATPTDVVLARLHNPAPSLRDFREDVHPETVALVARMLEADPSMRYPSYPALLLDMRAAYAAAQKPLAKTGKSTKSAITAIKKITAKTPLLQDKRKVLKTAGIAAGILLVVGIIAGAWIGNHRKQERLKTEREEQARFEQALEAGQSAWSRTGRLFEHIAQKVDDVQQLEEKILQQLPAMGAKNTAHTLALMVIGSYNETYNEAEDTFATAWLLQQDLALARDVESAEKIAAQLEAAADKLVPVYQSIDDNLAVIKKHSNESATAYNRALTAAREARQRQAEVAAQRRAEQEAKKRAAEEARELERQRPVLLQQEYDTLEQTRARNAAFITKRQFQEATQAIAVLQPTLTQPETQAYAQTIIDAYQHMTGLKEFLIKSIKAAPCRQGWTTSGGARDIVGADMEELTVALGPAGVIRIAWEQVGIPQMLNIVIYYLKLPNLTPTERSNLILAAALLCYESGAFKPLETLVAEGLKMSPDLRAEIDRLMPNLAE